LVALDDTFTHALKAIVGVYDKGKLKPLDGQRRPHPVIQPILLSVVLSNDGALPTGSEMGCRTAMTEHRTERTDKNRNKRIPEAAAREHRQLVYHRHCNLKMKSTVSLLVPSYRGEVDIGRER
jgi:hypothetical protein